jgi:hypothetical protein
MTFTRTLRPLALTRSATLSLRTFTATPNMSDQYSATAKEDPSLTAKLTDARKFLANHKTVLLTTRAPNGALHARTMAVAEITRDWKFRFIYDNESYKEKEVDNE